jgi:hypothetical protein
VLKIEGLKEEDNGLPGMRRDGRRRMRRNVLSSMEDFPKEEDDQKRTDDFKILMLNYYIFNTTLINLF